MTDFTYLINGDINEIKKFLLTEKKEDIFSFLNFVDSSRTKLNCEIIPKEKSNSMFDLERYEPVIEKTKLYQLLELAKELNIWKKVYKVPNKNIVKIAEYYIHYKPDNNVKIINFIKNPDDEISLTIPFADTHIEIRKCIYGHNENIFLSKTDKIFGLFEEPAFFNIVNGTNVMIKRIS